MKETEKILVISSILIATVIGFIANVRVSEIKDTTNTISIAESSKEDSIEETTESTETGNDSAKEGYEIFVYRLFDVTGYIYEDVNHNTFYEDPDCQIEIKEEPYFISRTRVSVDNSGATILGARGLLAEDGRIVYYPSGKDVSLERVR